MKNSQSMNILVATDRFAKGGLETHLETLFKYLKINFPVNIFFYAKVEDNETFRRISKFVDKFIEKKSSNVLESIEEIKEIISYNSIDLLHLHPFSTITSGFIAGVEKNIPVSITLHGKASWSFLNDHERLFLLNSILPNSLVFSVNKSVMKGSIYLPNPIDLEFWKEKTTENGNYILIVSRLDKDKTFSIERFLNRIKRIKLPVVVSGDGEEKEKLEKEYPWVRFVGFSYGANLKELMQNALIVCGMGRVVLESLALGKPTALLNYNGEVTFIDNKVFLKAKEFNFNGSNIEDDILFEEKLSLLLKGKYKIPFDKNLLLEFSADKVAKFYYDEITRFIRSFNGYNKLIKANITFLRDLIEIQQKNIFLTQKNSQLSLKLQEKENLIRELYNNMNKKEIEINKFKKEIDNLKHKIESLKIDNEKLNFLNKKLKENLKKLSDTKKSLQKETLNLKSRLQILEQEKREILENKAYIEKEKEYLLKEKEYLQKENEYLSVSLSNITNSRAWKVVKRYYKLKIVLNNLKNKMLNKKKEKNKSSLSSINAKIHKTKTMKYLDSLAKKEIFVFPPTINWNIPLYQRPHHFADRLSKRNYGFIFCTTSAEADGISEAELIAPNLLLTENWKEVYSSLGNNGILILPSTNSSITIEQIYELKKKGWKIIYDYIDEITDIIASGSEFQLDRHNKLTPELVDLVLSVSIKLYKEMQERFPKEKTLYLPNACDYNHFNIKKSGTSIPESIKTIIESKKPIIGYYGALAKWIDYDLITYLAEKRPEYQIILIGPDYDGSLKSIKHLPNIHIHPPVNYKVLPKYAIWFDVAIIPFIEGEIAESTSPIKLFEYMALGKPAVCTSSLKECSLYKTPLIAYDKDDFVKKVDKALDLTKDSNFLKLLNEEAKQNTWDARVNKLLESLKLPKEKNER